MILLAAVIRAGLGCGYITSPVADRSRNGWDDAACAFSYEYPMIYYISHYMTPESKGLNLVVTTCLIG